MKRIISFRDEEFKICTYPEVRPNMYIISNYGLVYTKKENNSLYNLVKDLRRRKVWRHVTEQYNY